MNPMEVALWITSICIGLRKSQSQTLADLVTAAGRVERKSLSAPRPPLSGTTSGDAKHGVKLA